LNSNQQKISFNKAVKSARKKKFFLSLERFMLRACASIICGQVSMHVSSAFIHSTRLSLLYFMRAVYSRFSFHLSTYSLSFFFILIDHNWVTRRFLLLLLFFLCLLLSERLWFTIVLKIIMQLRRRLWWLIGILSNSRLS